MQKNIIKNKLFKVTLLGILVFVLVIILIFSFVFTVKNAEVNLLIEPQTLSNELVKDNLSRTNVIPYNQSVFSFNRAQVTSKIEKAEPKIKVVNIETVFPNSININCVERTPLFALQLTNSTSNYAVLDEDFKVIDKVTTQGNLITITMLANSYEDLESGDFISNDNICDYALLIKVMTEYNLKESALKELFTKFEFYETAELQGKSLNVRLTHNTNKTIEILNIKNNLDKKVTYLCNVVADVVSMSANTIIADN